MEEFYSNKTTKELYDNKQKYFLNEVNKYSKEEIINTFPAYIERRNLVKLLALYEVFNSVLNVQGNFMDLGVYKGYSLFSLLHLINTFYPTDRLVSLIAFDTFQGYMKNNNDSKENKTINDLNKLVSKNDYQNISTLLNAHQLNAPLSGINRVKLIRGNVEETLPIFKKNNVGIKFKFISCDLNIYEPTIKCLDLLHPTLVLGGIIIFYAYGQSGWSETKAVDEFLEKNNQNYEVLPLNPAFSQPRMIVRRIK